MSHVVDLDALLHTNSPHAVAVLAELIATTKGRDENQGKFGSHHQSAVTEWLPELTRVLAKLLVQHAPVPFRLFDPMGLQIVYLDQAANYQLEDWQRTPEGILAALHASKRRLLAADQTGWSHARHVEFRRILARIQCVIDDELAKL